MKEKDEESQNRIQNGKNEILDVTLIVIGQGSNQIADKAKANSKYQGALHDLCRSSLSLIRA